MGYTQRPTLRLKEAGPGGNHAHKELALGHGYLAAGGCKPVCRPIAIGHQEHWHGDSRREADRRSQRQGNTKRVHCRGERSHYTNRSLPSGRRRGNRFVEVHVDARTYRRPLARAWEPERSKFDSRITDVFGTGGDLGSSELDRVAGPWVYRRAGCL